MEVRIARGCGLDVHQATVVACLRTRGWGGKVQKQVRTFGTSKLRGPADPLGGNSSLALLEYFKSDL